MAGEPTDDDAARRQVLDIALARRPDMTVGDLRELLRAAGMEVDAATVVRDLDALGFDIDETDPDGPEAEPTPPGATGTGTADATADAAGTTVAGTADATATATEVPQTPGEPWWQGRTGVLALAGAILVVSLLVAALVAADDDSVADGSGTLVAEDVGDGSATTTGSTAPVVVAPQGPGEDQELVAGVDGTSAFDAPVADGLGPAPDGSEWAVQAGVWSVADGVARLDTVDGTEGVGVATFDPGLSAYRLQVRLDSLVNGNGLIFGVEDADTYYAFVAAPALATFTLVRVRDGVRELITNSGLTAVEDDRAVIGVHVTPGRVEALVGGAVVITEDVEADLPTAMGLGSTPGGVDGTFDEVSYRADP